MNRTLKLKVQGHSTTTEIHFCVHEVLEKRLLNFMDSSAQRCVIITDSEVKKLYEKALSNIDIKIFSFPAGEASKTRETKSALEDLLLSHHFGRDTCIIAIGGGVVGDIAGFVAATYCRGVSLILIPTTLLAMVDAGIGGKTAVNTPYGKNSIGAFHTPEQIWIDGAFLKSLSLKELGNGIAEVIKYGLIHSKDLFEDLDHKNAQVQALDLRILMKIIYQSVAIKKQVVQDDPFEEKGKRRILNFGHTIGHALETLEHYSLPHGQAIAIGMLVESYMSREMGFLSPDEFDKIEPLFLKYQIPLKLSKPYSVEEMLSTLSRDKKALKSMPRFVLIKAIGEPHPFEGEYCTEVPFELLEKALLWMNKRFASHLAV